MFFPYILKETHMLNLSKNIKAVAFGSYSRATVLSLLSIYTLAPTGVSSAFAVEVPASTSAGLIGQRAPQVVPLSGQLDLKMPAPIESQKIPDALKAKLEKSTFVLNSVVIEGATVYQSADLSSAYASKVGQTISLYDARVIANSITDIYHNHGYILSQAIVPTQDVTSGVLKIRIVEGYIGQVGFEGDVGNDGEKKRLESYADNIKALRPAKMEDLERYMLLMNDLPGTTITGLIRPSASGVGSADLILTVNRKTFEGAYTIDNRGTRYIGPWEHTATFGANSMINAYDHTQVRVMTADPTKELFSAELQHDEILNTEGTKLSLLASHTRTQPGDELEYLHLVGESNLFEAKISHPFLRLRSQSFVARGVFDVHNTSTEMQHDYNVATDRLRVARIGGTYSFLDTARGSDSIDVVMSQGIDVFGATNKGDGRSNGDGDSAFTKANFDMSRLQPLPGDFSLLTSATGQYSFEDLLTDEQFSLGGSEYGRAFDPAEALGDSGLGGKAELRYDGLVDVPYFESYQLFTFADIGEAWVRGTDPGSNAGSKSLSSIGLGTRMKFTDFLSSTVEADVPTLKPTNDATSYRHGPRIFFSMTAHF